MKPEPTIEEIKKFYDEKHTKHQSKWLTKSNPRIKAVVKFAEPHIKTYKPETMLDLGCGVGIITRSLAKLVPAITAVDLSDKNIATARAHSGAKNITYVSGDFTRMDFGGQFNVVCAFDVIEHIRPSDREAFLLNAKKHCNGFMLASVPNPSVILAHKQKNPEILQIVDEPIYNGHFRMFSILDKKVTAVYTYYILGV